MGCFYERAARGGREGRRVGQEAGKRVISIPAASSPAAGNGTLRTLTVMVDEMPANPSWSVPTWMYTGLPDGFDTMQLQISVHPSIRGRRAISTLINLGSLPKVLHFKHLLLDLGCTKLPYPDRMGCSLPFWAWPCSGNLQFITPLTSILDCRRGRTEICISPRHSTTTTLGTHVT